MTKRKPRDPALAPTPDTRPNLLGDWLEANIVRDPQDGKFYLAPILDARLALLRAYAEMCWEQSRDTAQPLKRRPWTFPIYSLHSWFQTDIEELEGLCLLPGMGKE